jgi:hypothetical protein
VPIWMGLVQLAYLLYVIIQAVEMTYINYTQGHATGQTTGIGGHMAARFIPTVERESIDLM